MISSVSLSSRAFVSRKNVSQSSRLSSQQKLGFKNSKVQKASVCENGAENKSEGLVIPRRESLLLGASAAVLGAVHPFGHQALAEGEEFVRYYGAANPPATYGGLGGTTQDKARYQFDYPAEWSELAVSKVEKGSNGTDCKFSSAARKKELVYVVSLKNEGMQTMFKTGGPQKTLESVTGSDAKLNDAIQYGTVTITERTVDDDTFFDYLIEGADNYFVSATTRQGRLFAIFVNAPSRSFRDDRAMLEKIQKSFRTIEIDVLT